MSAKFTQKQTAQALKPRTRLLSFKEFVEHIYEPNKRFQDELRRGRWSVIGGRLWDNWS